jgi:hypothetical protein
LSFPAYESARLAWAVVAKAKKIEVIPARMDILRNFRGFIHVALDDSSGALVVTALRSDRGCHDLAVSSAWV